MPKKKTKNTKFSVKIKVILLLLALLAAAVIFLFYQNFTSKQNKIEDFSGYCVPLQGGSFSLENGEFKDYLNGYELNLLEFPEAVAYDPVCKKSHYNFDLVNTQNGDLIGNQIIDSIGFSIFPEKEAPANVDLLEFSLKDIDPAFKDLIKETRELYKANLYKGKTSNGDPYIRIYHPRGGYNRESYTYYINISGKVIQVEFVPGLESPQTVLNKFEKVVKSFKINETLTRGRKTILEE